MLEEEKGKNSWIFIRTEMCSLQKHLSTSPLQLGAQTIEIFI